MAAGSGGFPHPAPSRSIRCAAPPRGRAPPRAPVLKRRTGWKTSRSKGRRRRPETARPAAAYRCPAGGRGLRSGDGEQGFAPGRGAADLPHPAPSRTMGSAPGPRSGCASAAGPGGRVAGCCGGVRRFFPVPSRARLRRWAPQRSCLGGWPRGPHPGPVLRGVAARPLGGAGGRCRGAALSGPVPAAAFRRGVLRTGPRPGSRGCAPGYGKGRGGDNSMSYESEQP